MITEAQRQQVLQASELLMQKEEYNLALEMLGPMECVIASWMKGKIYLIVAEKIANSFTFKYYSTEAQRKQYREILTCAYEHLYRTGCLLPEASCEIRARLNPDLWYEIGKVENELARTRPLEDNDYDYDNCDDYAADFRKHEKHHVDSMIDQIEYWSLGLDN